MLQTALRDFEEDSPFVVEVTHNQNYALFEQENIGEGRGIIANERLRNKQRKTQKNP